MQDFFNILKRIAIFSVEEGCDISNLNLKDDLGLDSILLISLIVELESILGEEISFDKLQDIEVKTPRDLWNALNINCKTS